MAVELTDVSNTGPVDTDFPVGKIIDNDGSNNGTPVIEDVYGDIIQTWAKLMRKNGIAYNGIHDSEYNDFQLIDALRAEVRTVKASTTEAGTLETATLAEMNAGAATDKIVTPSRFGAWSHYAIVLGDLQRIGSAENLTTPSGQINFKIIGKSLHYNMRLIGTLVSGSTAGVDFSGIAAKLGITLPANIQVPTGVMQESIGPEKHLIEFRWDSVIGLQFELGGSGSLDAGAILTISGSGVIELA